MAPFGGRPTQGRASGKTTKGVKVSKPTPTYTASQKATIHKSSPTAPTAAPTGSRSKVAGWQFSTSDNAYHPPSWFAPTAKTKPVARAKTKPVARKGGVGDKGKPVVKTGVGDKGTGKPNSFFNRHQNQLPGRFKRAGNAARAADAQARRQGTTLGGTPTTTTGGRNTGGGGGGGAPRTPTTPTPPIKPPTKPPIKPPVKPTPTPTPTPTPVKPTTLTGRGAFGRFNRQRKSRGPRTGLSMTPEMLAAAARQRIVNYH